tara:strand:+ start:63 stop:1727 length:1665 start_codon:yes stop_codon:yes gene_type:complete
MAIIFDKENILNNKNYYKLYKILGSQTVEEFILYFSVLIILIILSASILNYYNQYLCNIFAADIQISLGEKIFEDLNYVDYEWHITKNPIKLMTIFSNDLVQWSRNIIRQIPLLVNYLSTIIIPVISLIIISPRFGPILIAAFSYVLFYLLRLIRKKTNVLTKKLRIKLDELNILLVESIQGIKDIKLSGREDNFVQKFKSIYNDFSFDTSTAENINLIPLNLVLLLSQMIVVILGTVLFISNLSTANLVGIMTIVTLLAFKIIPALNKLGNGLNRISNAYNYTKIIIDINSELKEKRILRYEQIKKISKLKWDKVEFKNVNYKYPDSEIYAVKDINMNIKKGFYYGLVGYSGSGKSTTIDIFNGLIRPTKGKVLINGIDLNEIGIRNWQSKIGYVPQQTKITDQSIKENIAFGEKLNCIDIERVNYCIDIVGLSYLIDNLQNGISTLLGDSGKLLSGGQRQLIAIARAIYKDPEIIIMDEATSSLDSISENLIRSALKKLKGKITLITIAHKFSNIKDADKIFVFQKGRIINQGDYKYLEDNSNLFKKFIRNT